MRGLFRTSPVVFDDRSDAGRQLAHAMVEDEVEIDLVVGLPRGGVPVAAEVATALSRPLDVIVVRKLGFPGHEELAMGAIGEGDVRVLDEELIQSAGLERETIERTERRERAALAARVARLRERWPRLPLAEQTVAIVDDGIATGATARAACAVARAEGARRIILAAPVAPVGWERRIGGVADEFVCVATPEPFGAVGRFYRDFSATTDDEVLAHLDVSRSRP